MSQAVGPISAGKVLAGGPALKSETAFASCNGTARLPVSLGKKEQKNGVRSFIRFLSATETHGR
jgi:hypothetical protein